MKNNPKGFSVLLAVVIVAAVALIGGGAYVYTVRMARPSYVPMPEGGHEELPAAVEPNPSGAGANVVPAIAIDGTADWQTYRNENCGYEIKYPADYQPKEYNRAVSFIAPNTVKCHEQEGSMETMCDESNGGPSISCGPAAEFLSGALSLEDYINNRVKDGVATGIKDKNLAVGNYSGIEAEGSGAAGAYRDIYVKNGGYIIWFSIEKEGNAGRLAIFNKMLSTFKLAGANGGTEKETFAVQLKAQITKTLIPSAVKGEGSSLQTYRDDEYGFTLKYVPNLFLDSRGPKILGWQECNTGNFSKTDPCNNGQFGSLDKKIILNGNAYWKCGSYDDDASGTHYVIDRYMTVKNNMCFSFEFTVTYPKCPKAYELNSPEYKACVAGIAQEDAELAAMEKTFNFFEISTAANGGGWLSCNFADNRVFKLEDGSYDQELICGNGASEKTIVPKMSEIIGNNIKRGYYLNKITFNKKTQEIFLILQATNIYNQNDPDDVGYNPSGFYKFNVAAMKLVALPNVGKIYHGAGRYDQDILSPDRTKIASLGNDDLYILDLENDTPIKISQPDSGEMFYPIGDTTYLKWIDSKTIQYPIYKKDDYNGPAWLGKAVFE
jgi:hypothetical protein